LFLFLSPSPRNRDEDFPDFVVVVVVVVVAAAAGVGTKDGLTLRRSLFRLMVALALGPTEALRGTLTGSRG